MLEEFGDRRVLLVEDDPLTLTLLESVIRTFGFDTFCAASATEAKKALATFDPDLAILDIDLGPGPTGLDFAKMISKTHPHVAVLFLSRTPYEDSASNMDAALLGDVGYLNKLNLHNVDIVRSAIEECLRPGLKATVRPIFIPGQGLTRLQHSLLLDIAGGLSNRAIATKDGKTLRAIECVAERIQQKIPELLLDSRSLRRESVRNYLETLGA